MNMCVKEVGGAGPCQAMGCDWPECCGMKEPEEAPMTKPVQIPQYLPRAGSPTGEMVKVDDGDYVRVSDHQAALSRVREMLEAKAKEWDNWADMHLDGEALTVANKCHFDLLALAATLGNQS